MNENCRATSFADVRISRDQVLAAARRYLGLPYNIKGGAVFERNGKPSGSVNCIGYVLYVARDLGLLPADFQPRGYYRELALGFDEFCRHLLDTQLDKIAVSAALPGDVLLFRRRDRNGRELAHVAFRSSLDPQPYGSILHAVNFHGASGAVVECGAANEWPTLESAWRLRQVIE